MSLLNELLISSGCKCLRASLMGCGWWAPWVGAPHPKDEMAPLRPLMLVALLAVLLVDLAGKLDALAASESAADVRVLLPRLARLAFVHAVPA
jgi:hypothetical protein